jgi:hypothetical protein
VAAPSVGAKEWTRVADRQAERVEEKSDGRGTVVLAVPTDDGFVLQRKIGPRITLDACAANGSNLGQAFTRTGNELAIDAAMPCATPPRPCVDSVPEVGGGAGPST